MTRTMFRGGRLIDGTNAPKMDAVVVIEGERIVNVCEAEDAPKAQPGDAVFDLAGRTIMPGMAFSHFHPAYDNVNSLGEIDLKHPPTTLTLLAARNAELLLNSGYTMAIGAGAAHYIDVALRNAIDDGVISGPRIMACGRDVVTTGDSVDSHPRWWELGLEGLAKRCDGPDEFRRAVREEIANGVDIVKLYPTGGHAVPLAWDVMSMNEEEIQAACFAAHDRGRKIRGHLINKRGIIAATKAGIDVVDHGDGTDDECIELYLKHGTYLVPSLYLPWMLVEQRRTTGSSPMERVVDELERTLEGHSVMVKRMDEAGVPLLVGDDFGFGNLLPHGDYAKELAIYPEITGVDPLAVIRWATRNGAALMGRLGDLGTIEVGKLADVLVVEGDPSRDLTVLQDRENLKVILKSGEIVKCTLKGETTPVSS